MDEQGRVLVVDDDETVRDVVRRYLELAGFTVDMAGDGTEGLSVFTARPPDLVVLDVMMPGINGLEVCKRLRQVSQVPIVMLTALGEEENRIAGLQLGADDYVTKPFSPRELALRVTSVLRRARMPRPEPAAEELSDGNLTLQMGARQARLNGAELPLTTREFDLLAFFLAHPSVAFSRADLLEKVWGWDFGDQSTVTVHVRRLREKIEPEPAKPVRVATVWGVGYRYDLGKS
ncbi:DNA-binding response regulator, OmpR family, contains REC and winged-helix (wHTH) domain [Amycolatopsis xylanica]|uniref:DNA-binding response regulator, OmpR family, contains REC and winged-helix (WHTH) domain n=1 Tax=Amycolatopsis xylanica TaxID=589385 RepID=A0A1H3EUK2_9PSEU|nr:response regulator transcription factor [Amycolatopsis xylanica]SDX82300.1 DNA-binding response regulator, OmpR family, contains REC and winged-helix (wHTH) domain [Amycolatopsis xylanica]